MNISTFSNRNYLILPTSQINLIDFDQVLETSAATLRKSVNGQKTFIKWNGMTVPSFIASLTDTQGPYTHEEITSILLTPEWTDSSSF